MQIVLDYPVNARATTSDGRTVNAFGVMSHPFEIREALTDEVPVVVEFETGRVSDPKLRYRQDASGQFFRSAGTVTNAVKQREMVSTWDGEPNFADLRLVRGDEHEALRASGQPVLPESHTMSHRFGMFPVCDHIDQSDVARCRAEAQEFLDRCVVVGKSIWVPCAEPVLKVFRSNDYWAMSLGNHPYYPADWHSYIFSIDEFDEARQWMDVLDVELRERPKRDAVLTVINAVVTRNGPIEDVRALTGKVMDKVAGAAANLADQSPEVIGMYARLKSFVTRDAGEIESEDVERAFEDIAALCHMDGEGEIVRKKLTPELKLEKQYNRDYPLHRLWPTVELHRRKWQDRSISVELARDAVFRP